MKKWKQLLPILLVLCMVLALLPGTAWAASTVASGDCGNEGSNVTWTLDSSGTLTISGTGAMKDYLVYPVESQTPWFSYADSIKAVVIEAGITRIGNKAFSYCKNIEGHLSIPDTVTSIGNSAFNECENITGTLIIPSSVETIEYSAFWGCSGFEEIVIPNGVKNIGELAFYCCDGVEHGPLTIPSSVISIGRCAFYGMGVTEYIVESGNTHYSTKDGVLFDSSQTTLLMYPEDKTDSLYIIPDGVTEIATYAFAGSGGELGEYLESVVIPASVSKIGESAFSNSYCCYYYFLGNAPSIDDKYHTTFDPKDGILYYIVGKTGWTDSDAYDGEDWNRYMIDTWDGVIPGGGPNLPEPAPEPPLVKYTRSSDFASAADKQTYYGGKLEIKNASDVDKTYVLALSDGRTVGGKILSITYVVKIESGATYTMPCQSMLNLKIYEIDEGTDLTSSPDIGDPLVDKAVTACNDSL